MSKWSCVSYFACCAPFYFKHQTRYNHGGLSRADCIKLSMWQSSARHVGYGLLNHAQGGGLHNYFRRDY
eukprot:3135068-Amphidinium_carterae.1